MGGQTHTQLILNLGQRWQRFHSPVDFAEALEGRHRVPLEDVSNIMRYPTGRLESERATLLALSRRLMDCSIAVRDWNGADRNERDSFEHRLFSREHLDWRQIADSLQCGGPTYQRYQEVALDAYLQYVDARLGVVSSTLDIKSKLAGDCVEMDATTVAGAYDGRDTTNLSRAWFVTLKPGETVDVDMAEQRRVELLLNQHAFELWGGDRPKLVDDRGHVHLLRRGRNTIGRDAINDVVLTSEYGGVSRKHLVITIIGRGQALVTNLSPGRESTRLPRRVVQTSSSVA